MKKIASITFYAMAVGALTAAFLGEGPLKIAATALYIGLCAVAFFHRETSAVFKAFYLISALGVLDRLL